MEPPKRRPVNASGIPRFSRLPVPRSTASILPQSAFSKSVGRAPVHPSKREETLPTSESIVERQKTSREHGEIEQAIADLGDGVNNEHAPSQIQPGRRRPRPSLSDRTMETLAQIPPSPSPRKRRSSLFQNGRPTASPLRPSSSMARARPSTSLGIHPPLLDAVPGLRPSSPEKRPLAPTAGKSTPQRTPQKASAGSHVPRSLPHPRLRPSDAAYVTPSKMKPSFTDLCSNNHKPGSSAISKTEAIIPVTGAKTLGARPATSRPSVQGAFGVSFKTDPGQRTATGRANLSQVSAELSSVPFRSSPSFSTTSKRSSKTPSETAPLPNTTPPKSSASLREAIAKAKAERQAAIKAQGIRKSKGSHVEDSLEDADLASSNKGLMKKRIQMARTDGRLNIAAMGLSDIPAEVMNMYDAPALGSNDGAWYESVDLVRLVAADNQIESLGDGVFPDVEICSVDNSDEDFRGNMFGGLETLDLHGNLLSIVPRGIRRLQHLTIINLSKNKLDNRSLAIISQVQSLRELRISDNTIEGMLDPSISEVQQLEVLDLSNNRISALPDNLGTLGSLHTLLLAGNRITSLPSTLLASTALAVLDVSQNRLTATLVPDGITLPSLKSLDVSQNALTSLVDGPASMASLQTLNVAENRLEILPDLHKSVNLITLIASGNKITAIPEILGGLQHLKNVDLSRNDLRKIDERFGLLESLTVLRVANNPLKDRKFLTLSTEDLKRELRARMLSSGDEARGIQDQSSYKCASAQQSTTAKKSWPVKPGGVLDRSSTGAAVLEACDLDSLIENHEIKTLMLQQNKFTQIPPSLTRLASTLTCLDISHNKLAASTCLASELSLPYLKSLNISHNTISSFTPLFEHLDAPKLNELNVSRNRFNSFPPLRIAFPSLRTVLAADNCITDLKMESVQGLEVLDFSGNEVEHLEPKLGLLGNDGLRTLLVGANRFRVPRRDIIEKGTGAILAWLRGRIPEGESGDGVHTTING